MLNKKLSISLLRGEKLLSNADEVFLASASVSFPALELLLRNVNPKAKLNFLIGIHLPSQLSAFEKLIDGHEEGNWSFRLYADNFFHPKLYLLKGKGFVRGFIGSGNFTQGGWFRNEELFHSFDDEDSFIEYKNWFDQMFAKGYLVSKERLPIFQSLFERKAMEKQRDKKEIKLLQDILKGKFNIESINFEGQYFSKEHHLTFSPENSSKENDPIVNELRKSVRKRLFNLNDRLWPEIQSKPWKLDKHYLENDIVASTELSFHNSNELNSLWIHYGRSKSEIKKYGDKTPLFFARLQVIIHFDDVGVWLRFGKSGDSIEDRAYFQSQMNNKGYKEKFFQLIRQLGNDYWIRIGEEEKFLNEFKDSEALHDFVKRDNWKSDYFIIGNKISPEDKRLKDDYIVDTVLDDFEKLYPLYVLMKDKSFE
ncbi:phospholipase D family protein [Cyclobacterium sp. SYSU L10401]|uniref:phospholipase D family protein n=1 Tax=Cyclobacterium sp. SYSU L10401 TaxID=2678657 RepID=UPI0013D69874|nr:phospholipase D family protein [Cyclobacterium sp. SYSU L10401]